MKGLWNSAKWELRESGLLRGQTLFFLGLWLIYDFNAAASWNGSGVPLLLSLHLVTFASLAVYRGLKWPFTGSFDLERTSDRPAWQPVLGRTLAWTVVIAVGVALQQAAFRLCLNAMRDVWPRLYSDGDQRVARLESWTGWVPFLVIAGAGTAAYVLSLTVALWCRSGRFRHRATVANAAVWLFAVVILAYLVLRSIPLSISIPACILICLPVSIWLLTYKVE